jgi:hypothetical protein
MRGTLLVLLLLVLPWSVKSVNTTLGLMALSTIMVISTKFWGKTLVLAKLKVAIVMIVVVADEVVIV